MKIYRLAIYDAEDITESGWILPDGQVKLVPYEGHGNFVRENPSLFGLTLEEIKRADINGKTYLLAYSVGAMRFVAQPMYISIDGSKQAISRNISKIHAMAKRFKANTIYIDEINESGAYISREIKTEELYKGSSGKGNSIYKISQYDDSYQAWILPSGEVVNANGGHSAYASGNYSKFGITKKEYDDYITSKEYSILNYAISKGAVRVSRHLKYVSVEGSRNAIRKFAEKIYSMAKNFNSYQIVISFSEGGHEVIEPNEIYSI